MSDHVALFFDKLTEPLKTRFVPSLVAYVMGASLPADEVSKLMQRTVALFICMILQSLCEKVPDDSPLKAPFQEFASRFDGTGN